MAKVTEGAVDARQLERQRQPRPRARVVPASAPSVTAVGFLAVGASASVALADLPLTARLLAIGAIAVGGYLLGRGGRDDRAADDLLRIAAANADAVHRERGEVIRAALALAAISGDDRAAERARRAQRVATAVEPGEDGGDDVAARRAAVHALRDDDGGESLDPAADADELAGSAGPRR